MKIKSALIILLNFIFFSLAHAGFPMWAFKPLTPTQMTISLNETKEVNYEVTNQSKYFKWLTILPIKGVSQTSFCNLAPKGQAGNTCILKLIIDGNGVPPQGIQGGLALCQTNSDGSLNRNQCYRPSNSSELQITKNNNSPANLTISTNTLVLAQQGLFTEASGAGNSSTCTSAGGTWNSAGFCNSRARSVTITNTGSTSALNVIYENNPALPVGTTITPANCGNILPGSSCTITITPGPTPSPSVANAPVPSIATVKGSNTNTITAEIIILTYGHIYQGGYVFAINDTNGCVNGSCTDSVNGKVFMTADQGPDGIWSSNGNGSATPNVSYDSIPGIDENSTSVLSSPTYANFFAYFISVYITSPPFNPTYFKQCDGALDGQCNTTNILLFYNALKTNYSASGTPPFTPDLSATPLNYYAAGHCTGTFESYSDWYLPAICEMGHTSATGYSGCGDTSMPSLQNVQSNLMSIPSISGPLDNEGYWSSTMSSVVTGQIDAWSQDFASIDINSSQASTGKSVLNKIRCVRAFQ